MQSIILFLFVVGIIMVTTGYQKKLLKTHEVKTQIEYRFIPRNIYDEQLGEPNISATFADMFEKQDLYKGREDVLPLST